ncbi:hypothetical protein B4U81_25390 [Vibrio campbellii]|nr:hypothetical protein B4U81_25390 [Vibrio campbellii]
MVKVVCGSIGIALLTP